MTQNVYMPEKVYLPHFGSEKELVGVEIGVAGGSGSVTFLELMPNIKKLYSIDPWIHEAGRPFELGGYTQETHTTGYEDAKRRLAVYGDRSQILRLTSDEAVDKIPNELDFVHIDGHHEHYQVLKDITNYLKKVRVGGILSGHDYIQVPDVTRAVYDVFNNTGIPVYTGLDFTWWVKL